jgi:hypothetical protein
MESIKVFIIVQFILFAFQFIYGLKLESYQYTELVFGSVFLIIFFGIFGSILTLDFINPNPSILNNSCIFAILYSIWFYLTKKITNSINSDKNGVILY